MEALTAQLPVPAETMPAEPMAEQSPQGLAARLGNTLRSGYEAMKDKATTLAAIGGIAFVGAQAAELTANPEPVSAEGNTPTATASNLRQYCGRTMVNDFPDVITKIPGTHYWGTFLAVTDQYKQTFGIKLETQAVPKKCKDSGYGLRGKATGSIAQPANHHDLYRVTVLPYGNSAGEKVRNVSVPHTGYNNKPINYRCTPGPGKTPVYLDLDNTVVDPRGRKIAEKTQRHRVSVLAGYTKSAAC